MFAIERTQKLYMGYFYCICHDIKYCCRDHVILGSTSCVVVASLCECEICTYSRALRSMPTSARPSSNVLEGVGWRWIRSIHQWVCCGKIWNNKNVVTWIDFRVYTCSCMSCLCHWIHGSSCQFQNPSTCRPTPRSHSYVRTMPSQVKFKGIALGRM